MGRHPESLWQRPSHASSPAEPLPLVDFDISEYLSELNDEDNLLHSLLQPDTVPVPQLPPTAKPKSRLRQLAESVLAVLPPMPVVAGVSPAFILGMTINYVLSQRQSAVDGNIPLHKLAAGPHWEVDQLEQLADLMIRFKHRTHVRTTNWHGETPLHLAASAEAVRALLARGADPHACDVMNNTPLHTAARHHRLHALNALLDTVTDVNVIDAKNVHGYTAIHLAVIHAPQRPQQPVRPQRTGYEPAVLRPLQQCELGDVIMSLIEARADVNIADDTGGRTPLFHAVLRGHEAAVRLLVDNGAAVNKTDFSETTPLQAAEDRQQWQKPISTASGADTDTNCICSILMEKGGTKVMPADRIIRVYRPPRSRKRCASPTASGPHPSRARTQPGPKACARARGAHADQAL